MLFKGLLILIGGFIYIFASNVPMYLIRRFLSEYKREGLYWGMGFYIVTFLLGTFIQNLILQFVTSGNTRSIEGLTPYFLGSAFTTVLLIIVKLAHLAADGMLVFAKMLFAVMDLLKEMRNVMIMISIMVTAVHQPVK